MAKVVKVGVTGSACWRRRRVESYWYKDRGCRPRNNKGQYLFEMGKAEGEKMKESCGYRGM